MRHTLFGLACMMPPVFTVLSPVLLWSRRLWPVLPWLGLLIVVVGTPMAFSTSERLADGGRLANDFGWYLTWLYGFAGLAVVLLGLGMARVRLFAPVAVAVGLLHMSAFHGFLISEQGPNVALTWVPGGALAVLGAVQWARHGLRGESYLGDRVHNCLRSLSLLPSLKDMPPWEPPTPEEAGTSDTGRGGGSRS